MFKFYNDREYYQDFFFEGEFATNIISLRNDQASEESLIAIENNNEWRIIEDMALIK